jgi:solute carrier family 25 phosphate transporter 23/24/25/41
VLSRTITSPLERLKILRQVTTAEYKNLTIMQSFAFMYKEEGFKGFFKGNGTNMARVAPFSALEFFFYEFYKH